MSITLITGIPGGGKSYWAVYHLLIGKVAEKYCVYHNIKGLKRHMFGASDVKDWCELVGGDDTNPGDFFHKGEQVALCQAKQKETGKPVLIVIDEAGSILGKEDDEVFKWLSWHRHEGQDIWIIVQDKSMIARSYRKLAEIEVRGVKSHVIDHFVYSHRVGKVHYRIEKLPKNEAAFLAYQSFNMVGHKRRPSRSLLYAGCALLASLFMLGYLIVWGLPGMFRSREAVASVKPVSAPVPVVVKDVVGKPPPVKPPPADPFMKYSYAGVVGRRVLIQDAAGTIMDISSIVGHYEVVRAEASSALVLSAHEGLLEIVKKGGLVQVSAGGGRGAAFSPLPTDTITPGQ